MEGGIEIEYRAAENIVEVAKTKSLSVASKNLHEQFMVLGWIKLEKLKNVSLPCSNRFRFPCIRKMPFC